MQTIKLLTLIVALFGSSYCSPIGGTELFPGFYRNANLQAPQKEADINKRLAVEPNPDAALKQISLQAFIGNLEQSLLQSAISVSGVNDQTQQEVPEVTPIAAATSQEASTTTTTESEVTSSETSDEAKTEHTISKRSTIAIVDGTTSQGTTQTTPTGSTTTSAESSTSLATPTKAPATEVSSTTDPNHVLLQTTKKVPQQDGIPAHILIDRISVQPHNGHIPLIPTFQVQHTKVIKATVKDDNGTPETADDKTKHISITQTSIKSINVQSSKEEATPTSTVKVDAVPETSTVVDSAEESTATSSTPRPAESASTTSGTSVTTEAQDSTTGVKTSAATTTTSTAKPQEELKHAEEDLKEKVAEIEAEPVILSARV